MSRDQTEFRNNTGAECPNQMASRFCHMACVNFRGTPCEEHGKGLIRWRTTYSQSKDEL